MSCDNGKGRSGKWLGPTVTIIFAAIAFAAQWGAVNASLDGINKRLDELIADTKAYRISYQLLESRLSFIEGKYASNRNGD